MSAFPARMGATRRGISWPGYWWSASVLTMTSAPRRREASRPAMKPAARPFLRVKRTMWSAPFARATSEVRSVEPSSTTSTSTTSIPGMERGTALRVSGSVTSSLRQGIWTINFMLAAAARTVAQGLAAPLAAAASGRGSALHGGAPGGVEAELPEVVEDERRLAADRGPGAEGVGRGQRPRGRGLRHPQLRGQAPERVVHEPAARQLLHPRRELQQRGGAGRAGAEIERPRIQLDRARLALAVQVEAVPALQRRGAGPLHL